MPKAARSPPSTSEESSFPEGSRWKELRLAVGDMPAIQVRPRKGMQGERPRPRRSSILDSPRPLSPRARGRRRAKPGELHRQAGKTTRCERRTWRRCPRPRGAKRETVPTQKSHQRLPGNFGEADRWIDWRERQRKVRRRPGRRSLHPVRRIPNANPGSCREHGARDRCWRRRGRSARPLAPGKRLEAPTTRPHRRRKEREIPRDHRAKAGGELAARPEIRSGETLREMDGGPGSIGAPVQRERRGRFRTAPIPPKERPFDLSRRRPSTGEGPASTGAQTRRREWRRPSSLARPGPGIRVPVLKSRSVPWKDGGFLVRLERAGAGEHHWA